MVNTYDLFSGSELQIAEKMYQRRLQMLVHSCLYYELDTNLISDKKWDEWARELVQLQKDYPEMSKEVAWYDAFKDWDASTGAFLPIKDEWVMKKAKQLAGLKFKNLEKSNKPADAPKKTVASTKTGTRKLF